MLVEHHSGASLQQHLGEGHSACTSKIFCTPAFEKLATAYQGAASALHWVRDIVILFGQNVVKFYMLEVRLGQFTSENATPPILSL